MRVVACLAEGLGIRGTARGFEVDPYRAPVVGGGGRAVAGLFVILPPRCTRTQVQLDELYALLSAVKDGEVSDGRGHRTPVAFAPVV